MYYNELFFKNKIYSQTTSANATDHKWSADKLETTAIEDTIEVESCGYLLVTIGPRSPDSTNIPESCKGYDL